MGPVDVVELSRVGGCLSLTAALPLVTCHTHTSMIPAACHLYPAVALPDLHTTLRAHCFLLCHHHHHYLPIPVSPNFRPPALLPPTLSLFPLPNPLYHSLAHLFPPPQPPPTLLSLPRPSTAHTSSLIRPVLSLSTPPPPTLAYLSPPSTYTHPVPGRQPRSLAHHPRLHFCSSRYSFSIPIPFSSTPSSLHSPCSPLLPFALPPPLPFPPFRTMPNPLLLLLLLFLPFQTYAIPKSPPPHDHWAQLLHARRYTLLDRPHWYTHGETPFQHHTTHPVSSRNQSTANSLRSHRPLRLTSRTTVIPPKGNRSKFKIDVYNEPAGIQITRVLQKCQEIVEESWVSQVVVTMKVNFADLGEPNVLAKGGGTYFVMLPDMFDTVLPVGAAEAVRGYEINANEEGDGKYDVLVTLNTNTPWFDGTTGNCPPDRYDMVTVILHEVYHNLVFAGSIVATVRKNPNAVGGVEQKASLFKGYRTRFDAFLANKDGCAVLGYLTDTQLAAQLNRSPNELLADACTNSELYFTCGPNKQSIKLFAPRVFKLKSSVYHIDLSSPQEDALMYPTIFMGNKQHVISQRIRDIQAATIDATLIGANRECKRPLANPIAGGVVTDDDFQEPEGVIDATPLPVPGGVKEDNLALVAGLPIWALVLIILFAILLFLLLLGLCLALLLRRKRKKSRSYGSGRGSSRLTHTGSRIRTRTSSRPSTSKHSFEYRPGVGGKAPTSTRRSRSDSRSPSRSTSKSRSSSRSRHTSYKHASSKHTAPSKESSRHTASKHASSKTDIECRRPAICPSTGKSRYICGCICCCPGQVVSRPPPVASVHTFDPDSVPSARHKSTTHKSCHYRTSGDNTVKKVCKSKTIRTCHHGCHCCHCCRYKPASHKSSSKCSKSVARSSSTKCQTKCETVCETSTKCTSTKSPSSSKLSSSKSTTCRPAPPSTKPPQICKPAPVKKNCCKSSCRKCTRVVEINVGYKC